MNANVEVPFVDLKRQYRELKSAIDHRIQTVLEHGQFILGPEVKELESALAEFTEARHCITVGSGTEALLIALMALGIGRDDEVITVPFTFIATAEMPMLLGAKVILVDVDPATCNLDPARLEAAITPRTKAIIPVSLYGQTADMDEINAIAGRHGIPVIEDAAQSFGAVYRGRKSCNLSLIGATSFFPSKPLGCYGDGGALFTNDDLLARMMREIRTHGQERRYLHTRLGVGGRMDTLQCAIVLAKFSRFGEELVMRKRVARRYAEMLGPARNDLELLEVKGDRESAFAQYAVLVKHRDDVVKTLQARGIPTAVHYPLPIHLQPAYQSLGRAGDFPVSERLARDVLNLPMHAYLDDETQDRIVDELIAAVRVPVCTLP